MAKSPWLQEVEDDANRITLERIKTFNEEQARKKAKAEAEAAKVAKADVSPVVEPVVAEPTKKELVEDAIALGVDEKEANKMNKSQLAEAIADAQVE